MPEFDHLAVSCTDLAAGAEAMERLLGVPMAGGGRHAAFGTNNRLLSLGGNEYLEVIAIDPEAPPPGRPRWFGLDAFAGAPRLTNWVLRCDDLEAELARLGPGAGVAMDLERGAYRWRMGVPEGGALPFDNLQPAAIEWRGPHPGPALPDRGCRLARLTVGHPRAPELAALLALDDPRIRFETGAPGLAAVIATPGGEVKLA